MSLKFHCVCGQALIVSRTRIGTAVRCPRCETKVKVPAPRLKSASPPPVPPPKSAEGRSRPVAEPPAESPDSTAEEWSESAPAGISVRGCEPHPKYVAAARWLVSGLLLAALCGIAPVVYELYDVVSSRQAGRSAVVDVWVFLVLWVALIELGFAIYVLHLPDWSSTWVMTIATTSVAAGYAMLLGLTYLSRPDGWLVTWLELADYLQGGRAAGWSFIMVCLTSLISYFGGRLSHRWYQATA